MRRDKDNAIIGGVCAGLAKYFGISVVVMRIIWILAFFWAGAPLIIYPILWILMPAEKTANFIDLETLQLDKENGIIAGVCAGIANSIGISPLVVRLLWIFGSLYFGFGIIAYLICWVLMKSNSNSNA
jgi:phage shock protein PspC (stress-responsive transcriptional regulator)